MANNFEALAREQGLILDGNKVVGCSGEATEVIIPEGVTSIGEYAFWECTSLTSIVIPEGVTSIGIKAFYYCKALESVVIPESAITIGEDAFCGCEALTSVEIPKSVTSIGNSAFSGCSSLTSINIPESVTSIGELAFSSCTALTSITIPDSVTAIGKWAFSGCTALTSINVDENNQKYKSIDGNLYSKDGTMLIKYVIGKMDTEFAIPEGVTVICEGAFNNRSRLKKLTIPKSVTKIEELRLKCDEAWYLGTVEDWCAIDFPEGDVFADDESAYGESPARCAKRMYINCEEIEELKIPHTVKEISKSAFSYFKSLRRVEIESGVTKIGEGAFLNCDALEEVVIPDTVKEIGNGAFCGCKHLLKITLPMVFKFLGHIFGAVEPKDSIRLVPESLKSVVITSGAIIPEHAFAPCIYINNIEIPNTVKIIESGAFVLCKGLNKIVIPKSVEMMGIGVFTLCSPRLEIIVNKKKSETPGWNKYWSVCRRAGILARRFRRVTYEKE